MNDMIVLCGCLSKISIPRSFNIFTKRKRNINLFHLEILVLQGGLIFGRKTSLYLLKTSDCFGYSNFCIALLSKAEIALGKNPESGTNRGNNPSSISDAYEASILKH